MRVLLLSPGKLKTYKTGLYPFYPRLGLRILAAKTPSSYDVTILEGERADAVAFDHDTDLVGISMLTPHARRAYGIADNFRQRGKKVVLGGPHPTLNPKEAKEHADTVVIGEGENTWPALLYDFRQGSLKPFYWATRPVNGAEIPAPLRLDSDYKDYSNQFPVETGRGCAVGCKFCVVGKLFGSTYVPRPVEQVVEEVEHTIQLSDGDPMIIFNENLLGNPGPAQELCKHIEPLEVRWSAEGDLHHLSDDAYLDAIKRAGCDWIYVETKLVSRMANPRIHEQHQDALQKIQSKGINLSINFTIGYDDHDESIVQDVRDFITGGGLAPFSWIQILTPWPGTSLFKYLDSQDRILTRDWDLYNNLEVVFKPKQMSSETLSHMFKKLWLELGVLKKRYFRSRGYALNA